VVNKHDKKTTQRAFSRAVIEGLLSIDWTEDNYVSKYEFRGFDKLSRPVFRHKADLKEIRANSDKGESLCKMERQKV